jgi:aminoglycoside phosphotransferase (APT) family kinase protein
MDLERALGPDGLGIGDQVIASERREGLVDGLSAAVARIARLGLPETLVHGDFHTDNVALAGDRAVIIDWSDAAIGSPAVDLVTWTAWTESPSEAEAATDGGSTPGRRTGIQRPSAPAR